MGIGKPIKYKYFSLSYQYNILKMKFFLLILYFHYYDFICKMNFDQYVVMWCIEKRMLANMNFQII